MMSRLTKALIWGGLFFLNLVASFSEANSLQPDEVSPPRVSGPLYDGAEFLEVWGIRPPAEVHVYAVKGKTAHVLKGTGKCWLETCGIDVEPLEAGEKITATQTIDGITGSETRDEHAPIVQSVPENNLDPKHNKEKLSPPRIGAPLNACQRVIPITNVLEGAYVKAFLDDEQDPIGRTKTVWNYARPWTADILEEGDPIRATQELYNMAPSDKSPEKHVGSKPKKDQIGRPEVDKNTVIVGSNLITVRNLWIGAVVQVYYEEPGHAPRVILRSIASWRTTNWPIDPPIEAAWAGCPDCIKAEQSLCEHTVASDGVPVRDSIDPPVIAEPLCAGSFVVPVCNAEGPSTLKISKRNQPDDKQLAWQGAALEWGTALTEGDPTGRCTPVTLGNNHSLQSGDEIFATKIVGVLESESHPDVPVVTESAPKFHIAGGTYCKPCQGQDQAPIFIGDSLVSGSGPIFRASMCGAELATVEVRKPDGSVLDTITLTELDGQAGHFEGQLNPTKYGWTSYSDVSHGKYTAKFTIWPDRAGSEKEIPFHVTTQGCVNCQVMDFHRACIDRINEVRASENVAPVARDESHEGCSDVDARFNYEAGTPHARTCGSAQNECSTKSSTNEILDSCIRQEMYIEEKLCYQRHLNGDQTACFSLDPKKIPACDCQYGHYENMTSGSYTKAACGIYVTPYGSLKSVQNFWY